MRTEPIKDALTLCGTQRKLAERIGVSQPAIHKALKREAGGKPLSPQMAVRLAGILKIPRHDLRPDLWRAPRRKAAA